MTYYLGIDGGGSNLRVVLVDEALNVVAETPRGTVNPNIIGFDAATALIQSAIREIAPGVTEIAAVGIGIAGASLAFDWMRETVAGVLPAVPVFPAIDVEVALVGAHGERRGALILAGTGSIAYGINDMGETAQAGGWGYALGDEGGGYWLGLQALRAVTHWSDGLAPDAEPLARRVMDALRCAKPRDVIAWAYPPNVKATAELARIVLNAADADDPYARRVVASGAWRLTEFTHAVLRRLDAPHLPVAFAGSLLTSENPLSRDVCRYLGLSEIPRSHYPPVIGAALLAKILSKA